MAFNSPPDSLILSGIGLLTGVACRSDMLPFNAYRLPNWVNKIASALRPLIGSTDPGFRPVSALPESELATRSSVTGAQETTNPGPAPPDLTSGVPNTANAPRNPTQEEIAQLSVMFPSATRAQILNAIGST